MDAIGKLVDESGKTLQLLNCMCDITQFFISILVDDASSKNLGKLFMEQVVLSFGIVAVVVVDANRKFLNLFQDMYQRLDFIFWPLARGDHKGNSVENTIDSSIRRRPLLALIWEPVFLLLRTPKLLNMLGTALQ